MEEAVCAESPLRFSKALAEYLEEHIRGGGKGDARTIVQLLVQFLIDVMDDPFLHGFDEDAVRRLDEMMPEIPNRKNIPRERCVSVSARYFYAIEHGREGHERLTEMRIRNNYHDALSRFFTWAIDKGYYPYPKPAFIRTSPEDLVSLQRDAFKPDEARKRRHEVDMCWIKPSQGYHVPLPIIPLPHAHSVGRIFYREEPSEDRPLRMVPSEGFDTRQTLLHPKDAQGDLGRKMRCMSRADPGSPFRAD